MNWERSISGVSSPECTDAGCNPVNCANMAIDELENLVVQEEGKINFTPHPFNATDVCKVVGVYRCPGPIVGDTSRVCGQVLTASLFDRDEQGLLSGDFGSTVTLE
jgi:hypothetical protein